MSVQTRGRLLSAAKKVFSRMGYHNAQISHIIDEAGVARGTFYLHFRSKEEIFKEILKEVVAELRNIIKVVDPSRDPVEQVVENIAGVIEFALEEKDLARIVLERNSDPELFGAINEFFEELAVMIQSSLEKGIRLGLIRECDTEILSRSVMGALKEVIRSLLDREEVDTYGVAREILEVGLNGVWKRKEGGEEDGGSSALQGV
jgi:AcrR family transcriptional regulator